MNSHASQQMHGEICEDYRKKEAREWLASDRRALCPTCQGRKMIIPMGYQGEATDCPTCTVKQARNALRDALAKAKGEA